MCPQDVAYTQAQDMQAAAEMKALVKENPNSILYSTYMPNYANLRGRLEACLKVSK